ncbi:MAG: carboxyl transferase domain-containing protein, partial [Pygmaiobacter sp.]
MSMNDYSMPCYFQNMPVIGNPVAPNADNEVEMRAIEAEIHELADIALDAGRSTESLNASGQFTALQRIEALVDEGTFCPLNTLYNPQGNDHGTTGIVKGLGRIEGK